MQENEAEKEETKEEIQKNEAEENELELETMNRCPPINVCYYCWGFVLLSETVCYLCLLKELGLVCGQSLTPLSSSPTPRPRPPSSPSLLPTLPSEKFFPTLADTISPNAWPVNPTLTAPELTPLLSYSTSSLKLRSSPLAESSSSRVGPRPSRLGTPIPLELTSPPPQPGSEPLHTLPCLEPTSSPPSQPESSLSRSWP